MLVNPIGDRVVICKDDDKSVTKGGILLPNDIKIPTITGRIVGISPKVENDFDYSNIKKYCKVIFYPCHAIPVDIDRNNKLFIVSISDIIAVLDSENQKDDERGVSCEIA